MAYASQALDVTIIDRQNNASSYTYVVPGSSSDHHGDRELLWLGE